jgi:HrpA-like RNA helicase
VWRPEPEKHHAAQTARAAHPSYAHLQAARQGLPAWAFREQVQQMVRDHQVRRRVVVVVAQRLRL